ncbi:MAG: hypothetical protein QNK30_00565 [Bacteroidales bacterium]|nr:hypothetical protein [Bacteroidales bacterium]
MLIDKYITIEELVKKIPASVQYLMNQGIKCIACGEPIWGTLEEAALEKGFNTESIQKFVDDLNNLDRNQILSRETTK